MSGLVWFRNDLRVNDNVTLAKAFAAHEKVYAAYCFDPKDFERTQLGFPKTGSYRAQFIIEAVAELGKSIEELGGQLIIRSGDAVEQISLLAEELNVECVWTSQEVTSEEVSTEERLEEELWKKHIRMEKVWQSTLYHLEDLPLPMSKLPDIFTLFRKGIEKESSVRPLADYSPRFSKDETVKGGTIPKVTDLGLETPTQDARGVLGFEGGEKSAWNRLNHYFWDRQHLSSYKNTRNGLLGADYSSKFSPWLAAGCISARQIYHEVKRYERQIKKNSSTYWLVFELIWRDYFRFVAKKYDDQLFHAKGIKNKAAYFTQAQGTFQSWINGNTGQSFVDANMIELKQTGFMSNRGRQNVASYLVKDLEIDWRWGASYFESMLIDYDPCSNWGNWQYVAGVGNDPRENRYFNVSNQAERYDPKGAYVNHWLSGRTVGSI